MKIRRLPLGPAKRISGRERRWLDPQWGLVKLSERAVDRYVERRLFPLLPISAPYSWLLRRRFRLSEATLEPPRWPMEVDPLRILLVTDVHAGPFLRRGVLGELFESLMELGPDLVALGGDLVSGDPSDVDPFLEEIRVLSRAPLGAFFCFGNHDHYGRDPDGLRRRLASVGVRTLENESLPLRHGRGGFRIGGIDDRILGRPDWRRFTPGHGHRPDLLLAHNPDDFREAEALGIPLVLSGHTHGGQIRLPGGPPIIRQSRFRLDEGAYVHGESLLVVSTGLGAVGLPLRIGADPECVWLEIRPPGRGQDRSSEPSGTPVRSGA